MLAARINRYGRDLPVQPAVRQHMAFVALLVSCDGHSWIPSSKFCHKLVMQKEAVMWLSAGIMLVTKALGASCA
jgi:hypothetical protein